MEATVQEAISAFIRQYHHNGTQYWQSKSAESDRIYVRLLECVPSLINFPQLLRSCCEQSSTIFATKTLSDLELEPILGLLCALATLPGCGVELLTMDTVGVGIASCLLDVGRSKKVLGMACQLTWQLASEGGGGAISQGVLEGIRELLKRDYTTPYALKAVTVLALGDVPTNTLQLSQHGGADAVVSAVSSLAQTRDTELLEDALRAVWNLTNNGARDLLGQAGASEAAISAAAHRKRHAGVWQQLVGALWALSADSESHKARMIQAGILGDVLVHGLQTFLRPEEAGLREALLGLVTNLAADSPARREQMGSLGICQLLLDAFNYLPVGLDSSVAYYMYGLQAMASLCIDSTDNVRRLGINGCSIVMAVLENEELMACHNVPGVGLLCFKWLHEQTCLVVARLLSVPEHSSLLWTDTVCLALVKLLGTGDWCQYVPFTEAVLVALRSVVASQGLRTEATRESDKARYRLLLGAPSMLCDSLCMLLGEAQVDHDGQRLVAEEGLRLAVLILRMSVSVSGINPIEVMGTGTMCGNVSRLLSQGITRRCHVLMAVACDVIACLAAGSPQVAHQLLAIKVQDLMVPVLQAATGAGNVKLAHYACTSILALEASLKGTDMGQALYTGWAAQGMATQLCAHLGQFERCAAIDVTRRILVSAVASVMLLLRYESVTVVRGEQRAAVARLVTSVRGRAGQVPADCSLYMSQVSQWLYQSG